MPDLLEFFIPNRILDLEDTTTSNPKHYRIDMSFNFDVPMRQQLDDLTRLFDSLLREKSPTALFSKPELFFPLYLYVKGMDLDNADVPVIKAARHKICHEIGERMKKLLQVTATFLRKRNENEQSVSATLEICLRSTLKMYTLILCSILMSTAPSTEEDDGGFTSSTTHTQRSTIGRRKRRRSDTDTGFGDDKSGVDMDGRELALTSLIDLCSPEIMTLWPDDCLESGTLNIMMKMVLNMITQKANIGNDAQSIASALALLLMRIMSHTLGKNQSLASDDLVSPLVELALKSENVAIFLSKLLADMAQSDMSPLFAENIIQALFTGLVHAALHGAVSDAVAGKNVALFLTEISKRSVSIIIKMADVILTIIQSENHDIRKAVITCFAEMIIQRYTTSLRSSSEGDVRDKYLNELLFRIMDVNPFVRNHSLHTWERLVESKAVPKRYNIALTESVVGRLEDKNYLVRDSAMAVVSCILRKNWFGHVLNAPLLNTKLGASKEEGLAKFLGDAAEMESQLCSYRKKLRPKSEPVDDPLEDVMECEREKVEEERVSQRLSSLSDEQVAVLNKIFFYEGALSFVVLIHTALEYASVLLDSRTERDVLGAIKLIVACSEYHLEGSEAAFRKILVMVFEGEIKTQLTVCDAFVEVIFAAFNRLPGSVVTRATASAHKLINVLKGAGEGEVSAVDRIFSLLTRSSAYSRLLSSQFLDAVWGIAESSLDREATVCDRRTAMRIYGLLCKYAWKDIRMRKESILEFLDSSAPKDNMLLAYVFTALQCETLDPQFHPISSSVNPKTHPVLKHLITHLCRKTTALASWMCLAEAAMNALYNLCDVPAVLYRYILDYLSSCAKSRDDCNTVSQLLFVVGHTALKQLVAVESVERQQLKALEEPSKVPVGSHTDYMHKELGLESHEFKRHTIQVLAQERRQAILAEGSIWHRFASDVVSNCQRKTIAITDDQLLGRVCAVMALCRLMVVDESFCEKNLNFLLSIATDKRESWVVKTNIVIALGDLACVHPNLLTPCLSVPTAGLFKMLTDDDLRVRAVTIQVCSHLVLGEMLRIRGHLYTIVKLVADPDETIARNAVTFVQNLAMKEKERTGNFIPPLVTKLSNLMPSDKFQLAMRVLLERVEGDKPTDSLIERLCDRFESYSERSKKKQQVARNLAFCLNELNYGTERPIKRIISEACYQKYRSWLRDAEVFDFFKTILAKAKKPSRGGNERRDKSAIEEWESRMILDSCAKESEGQNESDDRADS